MITYVHIHSRLPALDYFVTLGHLHLVSALCWHQCHILQSSGCVAYPIIAAMLQ